MIRTPACITLAALFSTVALAQTTPTAHRATTTHRTGATSTKTTTAADPADNPPKVPRIAGTPKPLYALRYVDTLIGTGEPAQPRKYYTVRYTGWLTDGTKFDSSEDHPGKAPITFPYGARQVIPGWDTGFEGMHVGGKRRLYIPYQLAYGEPGRGPIPPKGNLIFDIELVSMSDTPPADPNAPPPSQPGTDPNDPTKPRTEPAKPTTPPADPTKPTSTTPLPSSNPSSQQK